MVNKTETLIKNLKKNIQNLTPIASDMFIPNHSGTHDAGILLKTPSKDSDLVNKKYVDDEIAGINTFLKLDQTTPQTFTGGSPASDGILQVATGELSAGFLIDDHNGDKSGEFDLRILYDSSGNEVFNWETGDLTSSGDGSFASLTTTTGGIKLKGGQDISPSTDSTEAINIAQADGTDFVTFDTTNKRTGFGISTPTRTLHLVATTSATSAPASPFILNSRSTGNMANGFGGGLLFGINDDTLSTENIIGVIYGLRDGSADNSGAMAFSTYNAGTRYERFRLTYDGKVKIVGDNYKLMLGAGDDCSIYYDGTNMIINPKEVGGGYLSVLGDINASANTIQTTGTIRGVHKASDGTSAVADGTYTMGLGGTSNGTITIKDGIITAVQQCVA